jgi:hypothetical protein
VPDDLLRHVVGPAPYSSWSAWLALIIATVLAGWYVGVFVFTSPGRRLGEIPLLGAARDRLIRHRFARTVNDVGARHRAGEVDAAEAGAAISRELRRFLHLVTGVPAEYMQLDDIRNSEIAAAATLLEELTDARFNAESHVDVGRVSDDAEGLIRSWT